MSTPDKRKVKKLFDKAARPVIRITFSKVTPGETDEDDYEEEHGWIDEEGVDMTPDKDDREEGLTSVDLAVKFLQDEGVSEASSSQWHQGLWYQGEPEQNYRTGEDTTKAYHLNGFSAAEEKEIYTALKRARSI